MQSQIEDGDTSAAEKLLLLVAKELSKLPIPFVGRETVLEAIVAAGGLSDRAAPCDNILSRPASPSSCRIVMPICYNQIVQLGDSTTNYQFMPGDRICLAVSAGLSESI